jgi:hypothetical protein
LQWTSTWPGADAAVPHACHTRRPRAVSHGHSCPFPEPLAGPALPLTTQSRLPGQALPTVGRGQREERRTGPCTTAANADGMISRGGARFQGRAPPGRATSVPEQADNTGHPRSLTEDPNLGRSGQEQITGQPGTTFLAAVAGSNPARRTQSSGHPSPDLPDRPFFAATLVNSAEGPFEYAFVALGIMLFTPRFKGPSSQGT